MDPTSTLRTIKIWYLYKSITSTQHDENSFNHKIHKIKRLKT